MHGVCVPLTSIPLFLCPDNVVLGHTRPAIAFLVQLLKLYPDLSTTLITAKSIEENCRAEVIFQLTSAGLKDDPRMKYVLSYVYFLPYSTFELCYID